MLKKKKKKKKKKKRKKELEACSEPCQTSMMEHFEKQPMTIIKFASYSFFFAVSSFHA